MLTFEEKITIIESHPELLRKEISLGRINFHYEESVLDKKLVVYRLHPNGNGYVYAALIDDTYTIDSNGMVNIRDFTKQELNKVIEQSIESLSEQVPYEETWISKDKQTLKIINNGDTWNIYAGDLFDGTYTTHAGAIDYLQQEGFKLLIEDE